MSQMQSSITPQGQQSVAQLSANQQANADRALQRDQMTQQQSQFNAGLAENALDRDLTREQMAQQKAIEDRRRADAKEAADREVAYRERQDKIAAKMQAAETRLNALRLQAETAAAQQDNIMFEQLNRQIATTEQELLETEDDLAAFAEWYKFQDKASETLPAAAAQAITQLQLQKEANIGAQKQTQIAIERILTATGAEVSKLEFSGERPIPVVGALGAIANWVGLETGIGEDAFRTGKVSIANKELAGPSPGGRAVYRVTGVQPVVSDALKRRLESEIIATLGDEHAAAAAAMASMFVGGEAPTEEQMQAILEENPNFLSTFTRGAEEAFRNNASAMSESIAQMGDRESPILRENTEALEAFYTSMAGNAARLRQQVESQEGFVSFEEQERSIRKTQGMLSDMLMNPASVKDLGDFEDRLLTARNSGLLPEDAYQSFSSMTSRFNQIFQRLNANELTDEQESELMDRFIDLTATMQRLSRSQQTLAARGAGGTLPDATELVEQMFAISNMLEGTAGE